MRYAKWLSLLLVVLLVFSVAACEQEGPAEEAGEAVDEAVEETGEGLEEAGEAVEEETEEMTDE